MDKIPEIVVPLENKEAVLVDFNRIYHDVFNSLRIYYEIYTDNTIEPLNFAAYTDADQLLIRQYMQQINAK